MTRDFKEALRHRRTYYHITNSSPISDEQIKEIIDFAVMNVPSAFNSQSTRIVLLLGKNHKKLWEITKETLKRLVSAEVFKGTEAKIDGSLAAGYGTILFFEDKAVVEQLQDSFPTYYDKVNQLIKEEGLDIPQQTQPMTLAEIYNYEGMDFSLGRKRVGF